VAAARREIHPGSTWTLVRNKAKTSSKPQPSASKTVPARCWYISLLPRERVITRRGGPGADFYAPAMTTVALGKWRELALEPPEGAPLPEDPKARHMWKTFWGEDFDRILSSNRKNVCQAHGGSKYLLPFQPRKTCFLHVWRSETSEKSGAGGQNWWKAANFVGAASEGGVRAFRTAGPYACWRGFPARPGVRFTDRYRLQPDAIYD